MLRRTTLCIILMFLAVAYGQVLSGTRAVPKVLNYQGYLTDTLGSPIDDSLDMTFKIYDAVTLGNELWNETQLNVPVEQGNFSLLLGNVNEIPDTAFTRGADRWLEMIIEGTDTLQPRTRVASAAYAYTATYSDTAGYARNAATDNDWVRGTPDSVLFTVNYLSIARGGAENMLFGDSVHTHTNLGVACTTGTSGQDHLFCTVSGGQNNIAGGPRSTVCGGWQNVAFGLDATIGGGYSNTASDSFATVGGGNDNNATSFAATVGGGTQNTASSVNATVSGGYADTVNALYGGILAGYSNKAGDEDIDTAAVVAGGWNNDAIGKFSTVGGGRDNAATHWGTTVAGGVRNETVWYYATVGGGRDNSAAGQDATVGGGSENTAGGGATVGGGHNNHAGHAYATAGGGQGNFADSAFSTVSGGFGNFARQWYATVSGGSGNMASGTYASVVGGWHNLAGAYFATVGSGYADTVNGRFSGVLSGYANLAGDDIDDSAAVVVGGWQNSATADYSFVGGGYFNSANATYATTCGGFRNTVGGNSAVVAGGYGNSAQGYASAIPGGYQDTLTAKADYSMAFGELVYVDSSHCVVFFDGGHSGHLQINRDHRDALPTGYPIIIGTYPMNGNGAFLSPSGNWISTSSRALKENFQELEGSDILNKIENMPVTSFQFKVSGERRIGPVAEDFYRAFGCGTGYPADDSTHISATDMAGVSLAAIQELNRKIEKLEAENGELRARIETLERGGTQ